MAEDAAERARREFVGRAPELRKALVAELAGYIEAATTLSPDEAAVLRHVLAYAGYSLDGGLYIPAFSVLWGGEASYIPAVHLPAERARAAAVTLRRRGVLRDIRWTPRGDADNHTDGVVLERDALRALAEAAAPGAAARKVILSVAVSLDGFVVEEEAWTEIARPAGTLRLAGAAAKRLEKLRAEPGGDIHCSGAPAAVQAVLKKDLVDALVVSVVPVLLGSGQALFKRGRPSLRLKLVSSRAFPSGLVQSRYERV